MTLKREDIIASFPPIEHQNKSLKSAEFLVAELRPSANQQLPQPNHTYHTKNHILHTTFPKNPSKNHKIPT